MQVDQCVRWHFVERQSTSRIVHIDRHFVRHRRGGRMDICFYAILPEMVIISTRTEQTPGVIISSHPALITFTFPCDTSVSHWYINASFKLHLPVATISQTISTQQLHPIVKSVWVVRIWLLFVQSCHLSVVVRQFKTPVCCAWVKCEFTVIWWREDNINYSIVYLSKHILIQNCVWHFSRLCMASTNVLTHDLTMFQKPLRMFGMLGFLIPQDSEGGASSQKSFLLLMCPSSLVMSGKTEKVV